MKANMKGKNTKKPVQPEPESESEEDISESDNEIMSDEEESGEQSGDDDDEEEISGEEISGSEEDESMEEGSNDEEEGSDQDEDENGKDSMVLNPTSVRDRIDDALKVLGDFKSRKDKNLSRVDIMSTLARDLSEYYGYILELAEFLLDLFSPAECVEYMDASDRPRPLVIRTNTLKTTRKDLMEALTKRGSVVEPIEWSKVSIKVTESSVPIGATPEYLAGYYMLQSAASLNPVMALAPIPGERVLDMSAAPGGKTSYIAQLMKNSGTVIANDLKPQRQKATVANLHRMGVKNTIVCCYDGRKIPFILKGFDRVLLDAPCSGLGVISRDQSVKIQRTVKDIQRIAHLQKELLCAAVDAVDAKSSTGGVIVYSTCSISTEENEQVINYILQKRFVRLIETGLEVGSPGFTRHKEKRFHPSLTLTRRFYPHVHNMDGFYVAKLVKYAHGVKGEEDVNKSEDEEDIDYSSSDEENQIEEVDTEKIVEEIIVKKVDDKNSKKSKDTPLLDQNNKDNKNVIVEENNNEKVSNKKEIKSNKKEVKEVIIETKPVEKKKKTAPIVITPEVFDDEEDEDISDDEEIEVEVPKPKRRLSIKSLRALAAKKSKA